MEVKFDARADCVFATFAGPFSLEELLRALQAAYEAATDRSLSLILLDCSELVGTLTTHGRLKLSEAAVDYWLGRSASPSWLSSSMNLGPKIAIVGKEPLVDGFGALVASNRGVNAKVFSEIQPAFDWLGLPK